MRINLRNLFPANPSAFGGFRFVRIATLAFLVVALVRSFIHLFSADGGAQSIAGVDTSVAGGNNIIAMFHQWGAIQLVLSLLLFVLFVRYPGLTPLIVLTIVADPITREISGQIMPITSSVTPPGAALNAPALVLLSVLLVLSLLERSRKA